MMAEVELVRKRCRRCGEWFEYYANPRRQYELAYCMPCEFLVLGIVEEVPEEL